ncbi:MAG: 3-oxoacyl-ACP synthase [Deinococcales bacterium]
MSACPGQDSTPAVGITGLAAYVPAGRISAAAIAEASGLPEWVVRDKLGILEKVAPGEGEHPAAMGAFAAEEALARAGVDAADVDVVVSITEEYKEYPVWTAGIKLAYDIGARNAYAYDVGQKCGTSVLGLKQAKDLLLADPEVHTVLVAGGYRNGDLIDFRDPNVRFMYNLAAGAGAAVVQRGRGHAVLGSHIVTDGSFSLDVLVPVGGTVAPLRPERIGDYRLQVTDPAGMKERLEPLSLDNFARVVRRAVEKSGATLEDVAYVAMLHVKRSAHQGLLERLGIDATRSIYLEHYGHLGQIDQILSLRLAEERGLLKPGDLVVLVAAGVGYVWNALCLRWGETGRGRPFDGDGLRGRRPGRTPEPDGAGGEAGAP